MSKVFARSSYMVLTDEALEDFSKPNTSVLRKHPIVQIVILTLGIVFFSGCSNQPKNKDIQLTDDEKTEIFSVRSLPVEQGVSLLKMHCYACHNPGAMSHDAMLAPPLAGIKYKYKQLYPDRTEFVAKMSDFVFHPTTENAVMTGPVRRFGLMPKSTLTNPEEIKELVAFIYDNNVEYPEWFEEHFEEQHGKGFDSK